MKKRKLFLSIIMVLVLTLAGSAPAYARYYTIRNKLSGLFLDIQGENKKSGAGLITFTYKGNKNQQFFVEKVGENKYGSLFTIRPRHSGLYLGGDGKGSQVAQYDRKTSWFLKQDRDGWYRIIHAPTGMVMDVKSNSTDVRAKIILWSFKDSDADNQKFSLNPVQ
jgi:hypothetical protein